MKYAYVPFNESGLISYVQRSVNTFHKNTPLEKFDKTILVHGGSTPSPLRKVSHNKQLYVFGHGSPRSDVIGDNLGNTISLDELARRLFLDGLSFSQKKLKLNACNGGTGGGESMAAKLKVALRGLGYATIEVYGYTESLMVDSTGTGGSKVGSSGTRAKDIRVKF